ncbi:MAG: hypothetical protein AAF289_13875 [Cyanobacteria bacterium P01_A01_bin.135]
MRQSIRILVASAGLTGLLLAAPTLTEARPSNPRAAFQELDLSFSQMRQLRGIMQDYRQVIENVLTPEQLDQLEALRESGQAAEAPPETNPLAELNLSDTQIEEIAAASDVMEQALQEVLTPEQLEQLETVEVFPY